MAEIIAYLIHSFPLYSSTFINDEVDELRKQGAKIDLFAVQRPSAKEFPKAFTRFYQETTYIFPINYSLLIGRHLKAFLEQPFKFTKCLLWILTNSDLKFKQRLRTIFHFAEAIYLYPIFRKNGYRHLHVHFLFGGATIALVLNKIYGLSYSLTAHGSDIFIDKVLQKEKLAHAQFTRLATEYNAAFLRKILPISNHPTLHIIPFGIDLLNIPPAQNKENPTLNSPLQLLTVGRLIWQKAQHLLLEACAELMQEGFDFHLRIIGEGPLRIALEQQIKTLQLEEYVTLVGAIPSQEVWLEYKKADIFILSSVSEGSPFVIMEAMACGLAVIAPELHGIPEMIRNGVDGQLFNTGSAEHLKSIMTDLMKSPTLRQALGKAAEISVRENFEQCASVARFYQLLKSYAYGLTPTNSENKNMVLQ